jgi:hypothetical protein
MREAGNLPIFRSRHPHISPAIGQCEPDEIRAGLHHQGQRGAGIDRCRTGNPAMTLRAVLMILAFGGIAWVNADSRAAATGQQLAEGAGRALREAIGL